MDSCRSNVEQMAGRDVRITSQKNAVSEMYTLEGTIPYSEPGRVIEVSECQSGCQVLPLPAPIPKKNPPLM